VWKVVNPSRTNAADNESIVNRDIVLCTR